MPQDKTAKLIESLDRIALLLEAKSGAATNAIPAKDANAFVWQPETGGFQPVYEVNALPLDLLKGMDEHKKALLENTRRFAKGLPANNALLWGARGTGKSSLIKSVHRELTNAASASLAIVEIHREDIAALPRLLAALRPLKRRFLLLCDDLSFDREDTSYKSLKSVLEGGIEGKPENILFYATSNRRHLMPRDMSENELHNAIHPGETVEEKVSLSDRFGLWLGFHHLDQPTYLDIVKSYRDHFKLKITAKDMEREALEWAAQRGGRSGRVAWQYITELAGRLGKKLKI